MIDDDFAVRRGLTRLLEACGHSVESYESAGEFLRQANTHALGCILLDVRMPELTGFDLYDRLTGGGCTVPIVFITGHGDAVIGRYAALGESITLLVKPFDEAAMLTAISEAIRKASPDILHPLPNEPPEP